MSMFADWLEKKRLRESLEDGDDPVSNFRFNNDDDDFSDDQDQVQAELFKTVLRKYPEETMDFLHTIAQRGDTEISALLNKIDKGRGPRLNKEPRHPSDYDEVMPPIADTGQGGGESEE